MPRNSAIGPVLGAIAFALAFGLVWHIWWLVILAFVAAVVTMIARGFARDTTRTVPAQQVQRDHVSWLDAVAASKAIARGDECQRANQGRAELRLTGGLA